MAGEAVDLALVDTGDHYDLSFADDGDFYTTDGLSTSLLVSWFTDRRASESEVSNPRYRRGWWGNLFKETTDPELGSKLWLLDQSVNAQDTLNDSLDYARDAYSWLITLNYADEVEVTGTTNFDTINIVVKIIKNNNVINQQVYDLWFNTVNNIIGS